jgi:hypothetical protein
MSTKCSSTQNMHENLQSYNRSSAIVVTGSNQIMAVLQPLWPHLL